MFKNVSKFLVLLLGFGLVASASLLGSIWWAHGRKQKEKDNKTGIVWSITKEAAGGETGFDFPDPPQNADHIIGYIGVKLVGAIGVASQLLLELNGDSGPASYNTSSWFFSSAFFAPTVVAGSGVGADAIVIGPVLSDSQYDLSIYDYTETWRKKDVHGNGFTVTGFTGANIQAVIYGGVRANNGTSEAVNRMRFFVPPGSASRPTSLLCPGRSGSSSRSRISATEQRSGSSEASPPKVAG
jgi:hypothetical protein